MASNIVNPPAAVPSTFLSSTYATIPAASTVPAGTVHYSSDNYYWRQQQAGAWVFISFHIAGNLTVDAILDSQSYKTTEGVNTSKQGVATLVAGTVVVANISITATSRIFLTSQADGGTPGFLRVSTRVVGTSFTILSSSATDTSTVAYEIFEVG